MLESVFLHVFNMSYIGSIVIVLVVIARLALRKTPKIFSYSLWGLVLLRLTVPFSIDSVLSLIPVNPKPVSEDILYSQNPVIHTGITGVDGFVNSSLPAGTAAASVNPMQIWIAIGAFVWALGIACLLLHGIVSLIKLKASLKDAEWENDNIYISTAIETPFVLGLVRPRIYLPESLSPLERDYILLHEKTHIRRGDNVLRIIGYLTVCLHWFNPLVWLAFYLSGKDMEMSCDEAVISAMGSGIRKDYSQSLLALATGRSILRATPLAFGEGDTKQRIKNILGYKRPMFWVMVLVIIGLLALSIGLLTDPKDQDIQETELEAVVSETMSVETYAQDYIQREIEILEAAEYAEVKIVDHKITRLDKIDVFDDLADAPVELWALEYRLLPEDFSKVMMAGGMNAVDGWITEDASMGKPLMVIMTEGDSIQYLGNLWTGPLGEMRSSRELAVRDFLAASGQTSWEIFNGPHILIKFELSTGETAQVLLSQPADLGSEGIWCVERWMDGTGNLYSNDPLVDTLLTDYYSDLQAQCASGNMLWRLSYEEVALDFINNTLGQTVTLDELDVYENVPAEILLISPVSSYIGYISDFGESFDDMFHFDPIEWLTPDDRERIESLGLDQDLNLPDGYHIYNAREDLFSFQVTKETVYNFVDRWGDFAGEDAKGGYLSVISHDEDGQSGLSFEGADKVYSTNDRDEFAAYLETCSAKALKIPFWVMTKDGYVVQIIEQLLPLVD